MQNFEKCPKIRLNKIENFKKSSKNPKIAYLACFGPFSPAFRIFKVFKILSFALTPRKIYVFQNCPVNSYFSYCSLCPFSGLIAVYYFQSPPSLPARGEKWTNPETLHLLRPEERSPMPVAEAAMRMRPKTVPMATTPKKFLKKVSYLSKK